MTQIADRLTLQQFLALPEEEPALEYDCGEVTQKVSPKGRHSALQLDTASFIDRRIRRRKHGRAFTELRASFANMSRVPDIAVYRWDRIPVDVDGNIVDDFFEPPDVAVEIISPGQSVNRLIRRCLTFLRAGVKATDLIDPPDRSIVVMRRDERAVILREGEELDLSDVIPELRLDVKAVFAALKR